MSEERAMEMDKQKELEKLFLDWEELHSQEKENPGKKGTLPYCKGKEVPENFYKSFCYDGFLRSYDREKKTVLFLCREANVFETGVLNPEMDNKFWMKEVYEKKAGNKGLSGAEKKYWSFLEKTIPLYCKCKPEELNIAYMNLNKRGGFGSCNQSRLKNYVERYKDKVEEEIRIIDPDWIICGGTHGIVKGLNLKPEIIPQDEYHPAYGKLKYWKLNGES